MTTKSHVFHDEDSDSESDPELSQTTGADLKSSTMTESTGKSEDEIVTMDETQSVIRSKRLVIIFLSVMAIAASVLTYHFANKAATDTFETQVKQHLLICNGDLNSLAS